MKKWSAIRHKLEKEYLAESLRGHIQYYVTTYSRSPDHVGRAAICLDGREILKGNYYNQWNKAEFYPHDEKYESRMKKEHPFMDEVAMNLGLFDQRSFYQAFQEFNNQSIEKSLVSKNLLIKIFALMDRRVGKRRLIKMKPEIQKEVEVIQLFYHIRINAEKILGLPVHL